LTIWHRAKLLFVIVVASKLLKLRDLLFSIRVVRQFMKLPAKYRLLNYGELPQCAAVAGISLAVHTTNAQNLPRISGLGDASRALNNNK
jgi:hypothetical protein